MPPWPLVVAIMAPIGGRLSDRFSAGVLGGLGLVLLGLGMLLLQYDQQMELAPLFAVILLLALIGFVMNHAIGLLERRYCFWAQRATAART